MMKRPEVRDLFNADKRQHDHRQSELQSLHPHLSRRHRHPPPLRSRMIAKPPDASQDQQIQNRAGECQRHHRHTNPVRMKVVPDRPGLENRQKRSRSDQKPKPIESGKECADTLQKRKQETRPCDNRLSVGHLLWQEFQFGFRSFWRLAGRRRHRKKHNCRIAASLTILHLNAGSSAGSPDAVSWRLNPVHHHMNPLC
jgi:hypothetical protein